MNIGFSTGSLALGDFSRALYLLQDKPIHVIELSALRENELLDLAAAIEDNNLDLQKYQYISFHAPSKLISSSEGDIVPVLKKIAARGWYIIVHPDIMDDYNLWRQLGKYLCLENMDKRKPIGRTSADMKNLFDIFPEASFCLDLAHSRQVDPTMLECYLMLRDLGNRLVQIHLSDVTSDSRHVPLNTEAIKAYARLSWMVPKDIPIILESTVRPDGIDKEIVLTESIFVGELVS